MWLTGRLAPDFKTIRDFRRDNGAAIQKVCRQFVVLCRKLKLFSDAFVAIDGSKFKALNNFSILHLGNDNYQMKFQLIRKNAGVIREGGVIVDVISR